MPGSGLAAPLSGPDDHQSARWRAFHPDRRALVFQRRARTQWGNKNLFDIDAEALAVEWASEAPQRLAAAMAQRGHNGGGLPAAMRYLDVDPLPRPSPERRHVGLGPHSAITTNRSEAIGPDTSSIWRGRRRWRTNGSRWRPRLSGAEPFAVDEVLHRPMAHLGSTSSHEPSRMLIAGYAQLSWCG